MSGLTVTQRRSRNGANKKQLDTLRSLGLRRIGHTVQLEDSPQARGMLHAVRHLVEVEQGEQTEPPASGRAGRQASAREPRHGLSPSGGGEHER
jgi:large subunit ribosomal protein L30